MEIRKTTINDLNTVMKIYDDARVFMKEQGNIYQWQDESYLNTALIKSDIHEEISYVCIDGDEIVGVFAFMNGPDECYNKIYEGSWANDEEYMVIHRIAAKRGKQGVGTFCIKWALERSKNVRIDTHEKNVPMRNLVSKLGFKYRGIVYMLDNTPRFAYSKEQ